MAINSLFVCLCFGKAFHHPHHHHLLHHFAASLHRGGEYTGKFWVREIWADLYFESQCSTVQCNPIQYKRRTWLLGTGWGFYCRYKEKHKQRYLELSRMNQAKRERAGWKRKRREKRRTKKLGDHQPKRTRNKKGHVGSSCLCAWGDGA